MKKKMKDLFLWLLVMVLLMVGVSGCDASYEYPDSIQYRASSLEVPEDASATRIQMLTGDALYYKATQASDVTGVDVSLLKRLDISSGDIKTLWQADPNDLTWINGFAEDTDGSIWYTELSYTDEIDDNYMPLTASWLCHMDAEGKELANIDLSSVLAKGESAFDLFATEDLLLLTAAQSKKNEEGVLYNVWSVYGLDKQGERRFRLAYTNSYDLEGFVQLSDGRVAVIGDTMIPIDMKTGMWGSSISLTVPDYTNDLGEPARLSVFASAVETYLFLAQAGNEQLYGYNAATEQYELLFNWAEQGIVWEHPFAVYMEEYISVLAVGIGDGYGVQMKQLIYE